MKTQWIFAALTAFAFMMPVRADNLTVLSKGMPYQEAKTWHEQFLAGNPTKAERLDALRSFVRASPYGERGNSRIFRNFEGAYSLDPRIPGVESSVRKLMSPSGAQAKGYMREMLYAIEIQNDPKFQLIEMNRTIKRPWGNTDADIVFRHRGGLYGRIEVKDVSLRSQASDIERIKGQIDKMDMEYRRTGQMQAWVNRREVLPAIKQYGRGKGIPVFEKVSTGQARMRNTMSSSDFKAELARQASEIEQSRAIQGGVQLAYGVWILKDSIPVTLDDIQAVFDSNTRTSESWRRLGEHGSFTVAGGAMAVSGGAFLASQYASEAWQGNLCRWGRVGGVVSIVALVSGEGFMIWRYRSGDVSSRDFWTSQWVLGGSALGGWLGSWGGGALGGFLGAAASGPGAPAGASAGATAGAAGGGFAGTWIGGKSTRYFADMYYDWRFAEMDKRYADFVYARYGVQ